MSSPWRELLPLAAWEGPRMQLCLLHMRGCMHGRLWRVVALVPVATVGAVRAAEGGAVVTVAGATATISVSNFFAACICPPACVRALRHRAHVGRGLGTQPGLRLEQPIAARGIGRASIFSV